MRKMSVISLNRSWGDASCQRNASCHSRVCNSNQRRHQTYRKGFLDSLTLLDVGLEDWGGKHRVRGARRRCLRCFRG